MDIDDKADSIGKRIRFVRKKKRMTQRMFGALVGVSHSHISNIENGVENPSNTLVLMICSRFDIDQEWLLYGEGEMLVPNDESALVKEAEQLEKSLNYLRQLFNVARSITKKQIYVKIINSVVSTLCDDSYYLEHDLDEPGRNSFLVQYADMLFMLAELIIEVREVLRNPRPHDIYKKLYDIQQKYNSFYPEITDKIRGLISTLCEDEGIVF